uniref:Putative secreted peptide n=1 Tax=Anopheles braziliensis TaxID=58242 RepID=A0A2M3ZXC5_9DIPT
MTRQILVDIIGIHFLLPRLPALSNAFDASCPLFFLFGAHYRLLLVLVGRRQTTYCTTVVVVHRRSLVRGRRHRF